MESVLRILSAARFLFLLKQLLITFYIKKVY